MAGEGRADTSHWDERDLRVLILTPQGRDSALAKKTLARSGLCARVCRDVGELRQEIAAGAGCVLIAEEALPREGGENAWIGHEPSWSSLPFIVLLARGSSFHNVKSLQLLERRPNISFLERPIPKRTLISVLRSAVEARRLQYSVRDALKALQFADRKKDEFLATLAHELRNPLAPIRNAIYVLKQSSGGDPPPGSQTPKLISLMERQVDHLVRLVDDLLEISRITTGKIVLRTARVDLAGVIDQAIEISEPLIRSGQHQLSLDLRDKPLFVEGDPVRLAQVFANLLNNAAKYTPRGGHILVSSKSEGDQAVISVRDNGIGIIKEMLPSVFELFTQSHRAAGREQGGLGIGLALVRSLVEMHGGKVEVRSSGPGQGSEFIVRLPLVARQGEQTTELKSAVLTGVASKRVMVVDDDKDVADSFAMLLGTLGAEVQVAYSGAEALSLVPVFQPRFAFLDLGMPDMDGYEAARRLRAAPEGKGVVLVALSGWGTDEDRRRAFEAGFNNYFVKPISLDALEHMFAIESVGT